jgi:hypothetical protein
MHWLILAIVLLLPSVGSAQTHEEIQDNAVKGLIHGFGGIRVVWRDHDVGFLFHTNLSATISVYRTANGGDDIFGCTSPCTADDFISISGTAAQHMTVWSDKWTPSDTGNEIHVAWVDSGNDGLYYSQCDMTQTGTSICSSSAAQTDIDKNSGAGFSTCATNRVNMDVTITKTASDHIIVCGYCDGAGEEGCFRCDRGTNSCLSDSHWDEIAFVRENPGANVDNLWALPAVGTGDTEDFWVINRDLRPTSDCTGSGTPYACCTGAGAGCASDPGQLEAYAWDASDTTPDQCTGSGTPYTCCTGSGTGTCGQFSSEEDLNTIVSSNTEYADWAITQKHSTGRTYIAMWNEHDATTADLDLYWFDGMGDADNGEQDEIVTNSAESAQAAVLYDEQNGVLWVCYLLDTVALWGDTQVYCACTSNPDAASGAQVYRQPDQIPDEACASGTAGFDTFIASVDDTRWIDTGTRVGDEGGWFQVIYDNQDAPWDIGHVNDFPGGTWNFQITGTGVATRRFIDVVEGGNDEMVRPRVGPRFRIPGRGPGRQGDGAAEGQQESGTGELSRHGSSDQRTPTGASLRGALSLWESALLRLSPVHPQRPRQLGDLRRGWGHSVPTELRIP